MPTQDASFDSQVTSSHLDTRTHLACDIGSNAMRILLGRAVSNGRQIWVQKQSLLRLPVRLGDDVFSTGNISAEKIERLIEVCELIHSLARIYDVASVQVCATSAVRESANVQQVIDVLSRKGRIKLEVIDGDVEASLVQLVVQHLHLDDLVKNQLFIDVGGGSTELVYFAGDKLQTRHSFRIGTVRAMLGKVTRNEWQQLEYWLAQERPKIEELAVVGTGGTINTMSKIAGALDKFLPLAALDAFIQEAGSMTPEARQMRWDMRADKADVIVHGCGIYSRILHLLGVDQIIVPRVGVADALVLKAAMGVVI